MRNIPFAFLDEETIERINRAERARIENINAFANLAETQQSLRGLIEWPERWSIGLLAKRLVAHMERMLEMSGPNSIANLERALGSLRRDEAPVGSPKQ